MKKVHQITYADGKVEELRGVVSVDYTNNWVVYAMTDGMICRVNNTAIHSILIYEE